MVARISSKTFRENLNTQAPVPADQPERIAPSLGKTGLKNWAGYISEEFLTELRGLSGYRIYNEMRQNEPMVVGGLAAINLLIEGLRWQVMPGSSEVKQDSKDPQDIAAAAFVNRAFTKMSSNRPFGHVISDVLTMFPFGWSLFEVNYKYDEGRIWWDEWAFRAQDTLFKWRFDPPTSDNLVGFIQRPAPTFESIEIPYDKFLLFRTTAEKKNPEGRSLLRGAYKPSFYKKVIEEVEAMGAERDLLGLPMMELPFGVTADEIAEAQRIVERIKNDDQSGLVLPAIGPGPEQRYKFSLLTGQGSGGKVAYTDRLIQRYSQEITLSFLAHFLTLGQANARAQGAYQLSSDQRDLFQVALKGWLDKIAEVIDSQAIPRLLAMNGMSGVCHMTHSRISQLNLATIGGFLTAGIQNKFITADGSLEDFLREEAELPPRGEGIIPASETEPAPAVGDKGQNGGLNTMPGANQKGVLSPPANGGGKVAIASGGANDVRGGDSAGGDVPNPPLKAAAEEDAATWEAMTLSVLKGFSGDFWGA